MRVLTVQQPWAWAIFHGKGIENRTQLWSYRGPLAIHAGARLSERGMQSPLVSDAWDETSNYSLSEADDFFVRGAVLGVVDLVDAHPATRQGGTSDWCCQPWGENLYGEKGSIVHLVLENPREFDRPIRDVRGRLGLWTPDFDLAAEVEARCAA